MIESVAVRDGAAPQPREPHPYFAPAAEARWAEGGDRTWLLDGKPIPTMFVLDVASERVPEAAPMEFVLVPPGEVTVDGLVLSIDRPFYIARTELSNGQYAALFWGAQPSFESYEAFAAHAYMAARLSSDTPDAALPGIRSHLQNPTMPALALGPGEAAARAARLGMLSGMEVRLPTLAEWFCAMRSGSGDEFWWGDSMPESPRVRWRTGTSRQEAAFEHLLDVSDGEANPAGLLHMVGNAGELAMPSERERVMLRERFGPSAAVPSLPRHREAGFAVRPHAAIVLGGAVTTGSAMEPARSWEGFVQRTTRWSELLLWNQMEVNPGWCFHLNWCTGARFVVLLPEGELREAVHEGERVP